MTVTLLTSQSTPTATDADALVIGVFQGTDGPVPVPDVDDIDLMAALTALGAAGKPEEVTKIPVARLPGGSGPAAAGGQASRVVPPGHALAGGSGGVVPPGQHCRP